MWRFEVPYHKRPTSPRHGALRFTINRHQIKMNQNTLIPPLEGDQGGGRWFEVLLIGSSAAILCKIYF